jgi:hypothetical protein
MDPAKLMMIKIAKTIVFVPWSERREFKSWQVSPLSVSDTKENEMYFSGIFAS